MEHCIKCGNTASIANRDDYGNYYCDECIEMVGECESCGMYILAEFLDGDGVCPECIEKQYHPNDI